ncbi:MAG: hypothetical protein J6N76_09585, partial [Lachnospiraceae bacterium]|nr:hypothetical protein [Lachnospiraceae bacterium]
ELLEGNQGKTLGEVFGMEKRPENINNSDDDEEDAPAEAPEMSKSAKKVSEYFGAKFDLDEYFNSFTFKSSEVKKIDDMLKKLKEFVPDQVQVIETELMGKKVRLVQKSNNKLYITEGGNLFELGNTAAGMISKIEDNKLRSMKLYGKDSVNDLLDQYGAPSESKGIHQQIRTRICAILSERSRIGRKEGEGFSANELNNIRKEKLVEYLKSINEGSRTIEDIEAEIKQYNKEHISVEGILRTELREIDDRLNAGMEEEEDEEDKLIEVEEGWTKEEQQVKNMVADLIYSEETGRMEQSLNDPETFIKDMLIKHRSAIYSMMDPANKELVDTVMKKMALSGLDTEVKSGNKEARLSLSQVVARSVTTITDILRQTMDSNSFADHQIFNEALKKALDSNEILKGTLSTVADNINAVVKGACDILQENVRKMTDTIFSYNIEPEDVRGESELKKIRRQSSKSDAGQGKFLKNVLNNYFGKVSDIDKRAMLSQALRFCKEVPELKMTDAEAVAEIKKYHIAKYDKLFKTFSKDSRVYEPVNQEEIDAIAEYKRDKKQLRVQANLLGGLLRGAGPLLQKMMQGMPAEAMPPEIREALKDMKSNLPPIPEDQVQEQFDRLIQSSGNKVTKIEKIDSLGAATVGQAFLCKIYGPKYPDGKEVVIKLLRPEAQIKMEREEKIILECAKDTDKAMELTYKGQLLTYKDELDLKKEADNIKAGKKAYEDKKEDVKTIDIVDDLPASSTALVLE